MIHLTLSSHNNLFSTVINKPTLHKHHHTTKPSRTRTITCSQHHKNHRNFIEKEPPTFMVDVDRHQRFVVREKRKKKEDGKSVLHEKEEKKKGSSSSSSGGTSQIGSKQMAILCGLGYWLQGFRCFPWLALNFHMASNLNLNPSVLQLVQYSANLPMVAKPLYGILSDVIYVGAAHRIPYIVIGGIHLTISVFCFMANVSNIHIVLIKHH